MLAILFLAAHSSNTAKAEARESRVLNFVDR